MDVPVCTLQQKVQLWCFIAGALLLIVHNICMTPADQSVLFLLCCFRHCRYQLDAEVILRHSHHPTIKVSFFWNVFSLIFWTWKCFQPNCKSLFGQRDARWPYTISPSVLLCQGVKVILSECGKLWILWAINGCPCGWGNTGLPSSRPTVASIALAPCKQRSPNAICKHLMTWPCHSLAHLSPLIAFDHFSFFVIFPAQLHCWAWK